MEGQEGGEGGLGQERVHLGVASGVTKGLWENVSPPVASVPLSDEDN